jgi:hypothetical protein
VVLLYATPAILIETILLYINIIANFMFGCFLEMDQLAGSSVST